MGKEKEKIDQEAALVEVIGKCANLEAKVKAFSDLNTRVEELEKLAPEDGLLLSRLVKQVADLQELTELQGKSISTLIEKGVESEKVIDDIVKQLSATRVPVPEKELANIKKFLVEKYHYKGN